MKRPLAFFLTVFVVCNTSHAVEGGASNYVPGFYGDIALAVEPPAGLSIRNDLYYYSGNASGTVRSDLVIDDAEVTLLFDYATFLYNPDIELFGGSFAFGATPTVGHVDISADLDVLGTPVRLDDDTVGIGDLTLIANLYWNHEKWNFLWGNYVVAPTGAWDVNDLANTSLNYWTIETDFMVTYFDPDKGRDYSLVVGYSYNFENTDTNYKSGDEFHVDFVFNQFLSESFGVGISGFFYRQLSGDSGSGAVLGDFKGEAAGIGPAFYWITNISNKDVYFTLKWLSEFNVKNRFDGDHVFASFALNF